MSIMLSLPLTCQALANSVANSVDLELMLFMM